MTVASGAGTPARLSTAEFIALVAMLTATVAFAVDSLLPALPAIGAEMTPDAPNNAQLLLTAFIFGLGLATFVTGPLSDAFGRKPVMIGGALVYSAAALLAWAADSFAVVIAARVLMGIGAAGPRVVALALVRDLYAGRDMARISSIVMMVFTLVPALAPLMGAAIIAGFGWRTVFLAYVVFSVISMLWLGLRQPETLPAPARRPLSAAALLGALREVLGHPTVRLSILVQTLCYTMLFALISTVQPIFDVTFGRADSFPLWFGGLAVVAASSSFLNALLVGRLGMRALVRAMLGVQIGATLLMLAAQMVALPDTAAFAVFIAWLLVLFFQTGLTIGNLNALAMEPVGHIAGMAASLVSGLATVGSVILAAPVGLAFNGTAVPLALAVLVCSGLGVVLTGRIRRPGEAG